MNAMRPWAHESELARYLDGQRAIARARTPSTPTFANAQLSLPNEDLQRVDQITTALHNLKLRLSNSEQLAEHVGKLLDYLRDLQAKLPLQAPERAFAQLQTLRDLIFWLPPAILPTGESDLAAFTLLSHLYASALALEPLFPEIGGAYLGSMVVYPLDRIHEILRARNSSQPQDSTTQVALSLVDIPMQVAAAYRNRKRQNEHPIEVYRHSPHASPYAAPNMQLGPTQESSAVHHYGHSPLHSPPHMNMGGSYFPAHPVSPGHQDSTHMRHQSVGGHNMSGGNVGLQMGYAGHQSRSSHDMGTLGMDYFAQSPYQSYGGANLNSRFVTPSQLWT